MTIRHHLSDSLLMAYSAAQLPEAFNLITAAHLSMCDDCRARLGAFDAIGGAMIEDTAPKPLGDDCLSATLARICGTPPGPHLPYTRHN
ncbi:MAG: transcriptional regulator, partial [Paracoccaceae bacterium]|nr:transcriptional regulator [Paracoccaceae bacterium]